MAQYACYVCKCRNNIFFFVLETDPTLSPVEKAQRKASIMIEASVAATTSSGGSTVTTLSNGFFPSFGHGNDQLDAVSKYNITFM